MGRCALELQPFLASPLSGVEWQRSGGVGSSDIRGGIAGLEGIPKRRRGRPAMDSPSFQRLTRRRWKIPHPVTRLAIPCEPPENRVDQQFSPSFPVPLRMSYYAHLLNARNTDQHSQDLTLSRIHSDKGITQGLHNDLAWHIAAHSHVSQGNGSPCPRNSRQDPVL